MNSRLVVVLVIIVGMCLSVLTAYLFSRRQNALVVDRFAAALATIQSCGGESNAVVCSRPIIRKLLQTETPSEILKQLESHVSPPQCHFVGHVLGQELYEQDQDIETALARCSRVCDSACEHGVIGEAFAEKLGLGTPDKEIDVDLSHLNPDDIRILGKQLCTSPEACHGVGHVIFQTTLDLHKAMDLCTDVALRDSSTCYNGVAMEYSDILSSRNMREVSGVTHPDLKKLGTLCINFSTAAQSRSCFHYFARMAVAEMMAQGRPEDDGLARVKKICGAYQSTKLQATCFQGYGAYRTYLVLTDQDAALRVCETVTSDRNKAACYFGQVAAGVENRQNKLIEYCGKLPIEGFQYSCYQSVFSYLYKLDLSMDNARQKCEAKTPCLRGYEDHAEDPWDVMEKTFTD